ncbi:MAG: molybdopterin molybdotransferase MoeA, partial [Candidatus Izimaplasma sp.]|nr:molybdopterin molybdotransferase MoeA [Candidatus Izimaplasma bacterium]
MFIVKSIDETLKIIKESFNDYDLKKIIIKVDDSLNYNSTSDIFSKEDVPHFDRSIVDGYAVDFNSVKLASNTTPTILKLSGEVIMGKAAICSVTSDTTVYVPTGGHLPSGANSVVMIENADRLNDEIIINKSVSTFENVLQKGTDISIGTKILKKNTLISPLVIGALKSIGITEIEVYKKLSVSIISTGDEIVKDKKHLKIGEIRDINSYTVSNYLINKNIVIDDCSIINDNFEMYKNAVIKGFEKSDIVISSGGSSVGEKDYTFDILKTMGATILVHGINIKPGKPTIIAKYNNKLFFGLPGQPTSAFFVLNTFMNTMINTIYHISDVMPLPYIEALLQTNVHSTTGRRTYQLVKVEYNALKELTALPLFAKSGMINALKEASGYIIINENIEGLSQGK